MRRGIVVALCIVLVGGMLAGGAFAGRKKVTSAVTLHNPQASLYGGEVRSKLGACEVFRRVTVFHDENDNGIDATDYVIGSGKTDIEGEYVVQGNQAPAGDTIIAQVARKKLRNGVVCKSGHVSAIALNG